MPVICTHCRCHNEFDEACCLCAENMPCYLEHPDDDEPDLNSGETADMKYRSDMQDSGRGHLIR